MGIGKPLADLFKEKNTNVHEVASRTGIKPSTLYSIIQRDSMSANMRDLWKLARHLDVTLDYLYDLVNIYDQEEHPENYKDNADSPYRPQLNAALDYEEAATSVMKPEAEEREALLNRTGLYKVVDDSMIPEFLPGDYVFVEEKRLPDIGEVGIFKRDDIILIRRRVRSALAATNPNYAPIRYPSRQPYDLMGTIVGKIRLHDSWTHG